jgi:hypothetical protein
MSTDPPVLEPRDPAIDALLESERADPTYAAAKDRLARRLAFAAIAEAASPPTMAPRAPLATVAKILRAGLLVAVGVAAGVVLQARRDRAAAPVPPPNAPVQVAPSTMAPVVPSLPPPTPIEPPARVAGVGSRGSHPVLPVPHGSSALGDEQRLVDTARSAVGRGAFSAALTTLDEDESQFRHGQLVEERELLRIQALTGAGRLDEAKARVLKFEASFPRSIFLPAVREAVDTLPP